LYFKTNRPFSSQITTSFVVTAGMLLGSIATNISSFGQEPVSVTVNKPVLPEPKARGAYPGMTFVALEEGLEGVARGAEPRSIRELQLLEDQQLKVLEKALAVTVNVQQGTAQGSGVIVSPDGYVLTAAHVAGKPGREATVVLSNGRRVRAKTLGTDRSNDAGLIKIIDLPTYGTVVTASTPSQLTEWPHASLGKSKNLRLGQWVIASGHPGGWFADRPAVVRAGRLLNIVGDSTLVSDCALIGGDSGGPLFDINGRLIGIHSRIGTETADNMHVPVDVYDTSWDKLVASKAWGTLPGYRPVIGVKPTDSNENASAEVGEVISKSPAEAAGLKVGDIVVRFDDTPISSFKDLQLAVQGVAPGDRVGVEINRQGQRLTLRITVGQSSDMMP